MQAVKRIYYSLKRKIHNNRQLKSVHQNANNNVFGNVNIVYPENLTIGSNCSFNHGAYINAFSKINIGDDVTLSADAKIIATGIDYVSWSAGEKKHVEHAEIEIGNHVWIGAGAQILAGVHISGEYVVIAAGAVVTKDITESRCIVAGCPASIIKYY